MTSTMGKCFNPFSLDAVNFLLAYVRGALGPCLDVFLEPARAQHCAYSAQGLSA